MEKLLLFLLLLLPAIRCAAQGNAFSVQELCGDETEARIVVAKNRDGKVGAIEARFNIRTLRFESLPKPQPEQPDWVNR